MNGSQSSRWLAWTGPLFTIVFAIALFALEGNAPGEKASAEKVVTYFNAHQTRTELEAFAGAALCALLLLFFSHFRSVVRDRSASSAGPTVMVAGAVLWAGGILYSSAVSLALVSAADHGFGEAAQTLNVLANSTWLPFIAGIAVTLIGAGMTVLGTRVLPIWLGWVALVVGIVACIGPGGFAGFFVGPLWMLVAGIMLAMRKEPASAAA
jgi:hypothetical protein